MIGEPWKYFTPSEYRSWYMHARPGETTIYALGYLPRMRATMSDVEVVANLTYIDYGHHKVRLTQKRLGDFNYEYRVTKREGRTNRAMIQTLHLAA